MFDQIIGYVKKLTEAGVALLALGIVLITMSLLVNAVVMTLRIGANRMAYA